MSLLNRVFRWRDVPPGIWVIGLVSLLMDVSSEMIHALLPLYLVSALGASMLTVGIIEGVAEAIAQIVKIFSGALSDYFGRRKLLAIVGYGLAALSKPIFPLAPNIEWIVAARFIDRVGKGIRGAPRDALVADLAPPELRGASFGLRQSLDTVGAVLGPLLAIALMTWTANHFTVVFWAAALPAFLSVAVLIFAVREPPQPRPERPLRSPLSRAELARLGAAYWVVVGVSVTFMLARFSEAFLLLRAQSIGMPLALVPAVMVAMNIIYALSAWPAGALSDRIGRYPLAFAGLGCLILANLVLAIAGGGVAVTLGVAFWGLHMGLTQGLLSALVADTVTPELRGTGFGMFHLITGLATLLASVIAGALWDVTGPAGTFIAGAVLTSIAMLALAVHAPWTTERRTAAN